MPRGYTPFSRTSDETETADNLSPWLQNFVRQQSVVEQARERNQPISTQVSSYIGGTKRYATVEDAVLDLRKRVGLEEYLDTIKQANSDLKKKKASEIVQKINNQIVADDVNIVVQPVADSSKETPASLSKLPCAEDICNFIRNKAKTRHGLVAVPAIQFDVIESFGKNHGVTEQHMNEEDVLRFISKCIAEEKGNARLQQPSVNLGLNVGKDLDQESNKDYFAGLNAAK